MDDRGLNPGRASEKVFLLHHCIQTGSGAHPASYTVSNGGSYPRSKAAGT